MAKTKRPSPSSTRLGWSGTVTTRPARSVTWRAWAPGRAQNRAVAATAAWKSLIARIEKSRVAPLPAGLQVTRAILIDTQCPPSHLKKALRRTRLWCARRKRGRNAAPQDRRAHTI
ncbi:hypothetical protein G6F65_018863 [Rhizopus arrhizus]|nr:hypothetical protein G6F65_018863 [Rhizopus arrhizus]